MSEPSHEEVIRIAAQFNWSVGWSDFAFREGESGVFEGSLVFNPGENVEFILIFDEGFEVMVMIGLIWFALKGKDSFEEGKNVMEISIGAILLVISFDIVLNGEQHEINIS